MDDDLTSVPIEPLPLRLTVLSSKHVWEDDSSPSRFATDGGFPAQMSGLSSVFTATRLCLPLRQGGAGVGSPLTGRSLSVLALPPLRGAGLARKLRMIPWTVRVARTLWGEIRAADAVHAPIPGDVGTLGIILAEVARKPLLVRYCGNWDRQATLAERVWHAYMERRAGGRRVMLATGGGDGLPSPDHPAVSWIFSTSLTRADVAAAPGRRTGAPQRPVRLISVGRQEPYKRTGLVIEALPDLPHCTLSVVGGGSAIEPMRTLADRLGVSDRVTFHGSVARSEVLDLLAEADVFVFPTESEGFPKVVGEAMAAGLPVVASAVSVLPSLLRDGAGVLLEEPVEPQSIVAAIDDVLASGETYGAASAAAARRAADLTLETWAETIAERCRAAWADEIGMSRARS